jgi:uncharacterized protein (TIGR02217 family)
MSTFPEDPKPIYPLVITPRFNTVVSGMDSGSEERTAKWLFPKYDTTVKYHGLSASDVQILWNFYLSRKGAYEAFYIYDLALLASIAKSHVGQYVATGDGATDTFDIPGRSTSSHTVYIDNVEQTVTSDYSISYGGGASGSDQVVFVSAPAEGEVVTVDFTGYLRIRCRFAQDNLSFDLFQTVLFSTGIELKGLAAA